MLKKMLKSKPIGTNQKAIERWEATKRMTIEMFKAFWQRVGPHLPFPGTQAGDDASYAEWTDWDGNKYQGTRKPGDGQKHGIVRSIYLGRIREATYYQDKLHGLSFEWLDDSYYPAFIAEIYDHGERKAYICWESDWSEYGSYVNKELILMNGGLSLFKP